MTTMENLVGRKVTAIDQLESGEMVLRFDGGVSLTLDGYTIHESLFKSPWASTQTLRGAQLNHAAEALLENFRQYLDEIPKKILPERLHGSPCVVTLLDTACDTDTGELTFKADVLLTVSGLERELGPLE